MRVCTFDGCGKKVLARGLCIGHYYQQNRGEELRPLQRQLHGLSEYDRFMAYANSGAPAECWEWSGSRQTQGGKKWHGQWRNKAGQIELAHRAAWRLLRGEIPTGMFVLHRCDNPACVNPSHLFMGSQSDNARDMWSKRRANPGTSIGEDHGMSKLTKTDVLAIRASTSSGVDLARQYGITPSTVVDIRKRRTWKHI